MGKVKDLRRKARDLALKERRLQRQGRPATYVDAEKAIKSAREQAYSAGVLDGRADALQQALEISKDTKSVQTVRRRLGPMARAARSKAGR